MNWILDHLQIVIALAGAFAWWLKQRGAAGKGAPPPPHREATFEDPALAERTRRIREEIQRKIEQRTRGGPARPPAPAPLTSTPPPLMREVVVREPAARSASRADVRREAQILEEQAALREKLREAEVMRTARQKRVEFEQAAAGATMGGQLTTSSDVLEELRDPPTLRRAIILREILGPPVALR